MPRVSIGIPVFNGERYLANALASVLGQSFRDFELILSDNASTDATPDICAAAAAADSRVRYERRPHNVGAAANFNEVFRHASSPYFMWVCADDRLDPTFLGKAVEVLDTQADITLCYARCVMVDEDDRPLVRDPISGMYVDSRGGRRTGPAPGDVAVQIAAPTRFVDVLSRARQSFPLLGLHRVSTLRRTHLFQSLYGSDRNLLAEIALYGRFHQIQEDLFFKREHYEQSVALTSYEAKAKWLDPRARSRLFPHLKLAELDCRAILRAPLSLGDKGRLLAYIARRDLGIRSILLRPENWRRSYHGRQNIH
jgi:glycosyltransferase involved in cell wall biosynthesis